MSNHANDEITLLTNPDAYTWRPLRILTLYRIALVSILGVLHLVTDGKVLSKTSVGAIGWLLAGYLAAAIVNHLLARRRWPGFRIQINGQLLLDIVLITALIFASGSIGNGLGALMVVAVVAGSILISLRGALFFAATGTVCLLSQQVLAHWQTGEPPAAYAQVGALGLTLFVTTLVGNVLSQKARRNQALADQRGDDVESLEALSTAIVQRLQVGVVAISNDGEIRMMNRTAWRLLGEPAERAGSQLTNVDPALAARLNDWQHRSDSDDAALLLTPSGEEVLPRFRPLGKRGQRGTLIFLDDVGQLKAQVQQAKLASLGRLTASIAHEIRNPLSAISHAGQLLGESNELPDADRRLVEIINNQGRRLNRVIESVLQLSRRSQAEPQSIELERWLANFVEEFALQGWSQPHRFSLDGDTAVQAQFDPDHLHQVLGNLCKNALLHGAKAGQELHIQLNWGIDNAGRPYLDVRDDGKGIAAEDAANLFEPFFTTASQGTGLGLYLCRELCEMNRARLSFEPSEQGARFRIGFSAPDQA